MRTRILSLVGSAAIALSLASGGTGVASADTFLGTTNGCKDYIDSQGHITTICRARSDSGFVSEASSDEATQKVVWVQGPDGLRWPLVVKP